jgi:hypothetical protein
MPLDNTASFESIIRPRPIIGPAGAGSLPRIIFCGSWVFPDALGCLPRFSAPLTNRH